MDALEQLLVKRKVYLECMERWGNFVERLKAKVVTSDSRLAALPAPSVIDNRSRVEYSFSGKRTFCEFEFAEPRSVLNYGYVSRDEFGREKDTPTGRQYCDSRGCVFMSEKEGKSQSTLMQNTGFFFAGLLDAVQKSSPVCG